VTELPRATWGGTGAARQLRVVVLAVCLAAAVLGTAASPAAAHGDELLVRGSLTLAPGEVAAYHGNVHYHRLVARVVADGPVRVRLHDFVTGEVALEVGPASRLAVNELIACCDDAAWTPYTLVIENAGDRPVAVRVRAVLVHDDLAVMVYGAESGTREGAVVITAAWIVLLWWGRRRPRRASALRRAGWAAAVLAAGVVIAGVYGWLAYGRAGAAGLVAGLSHVPVLPWNPLVSRVSLFLGVAIVGWLVAGALWARSRPAPGSPAWTGVGVGLGAGVLGVAGAVVVEYGVLSLPLGMAAGMVIPLALVVATGGGSAGPVARDRDHRVGASARDWPLVRVERRAGQSGQEGGSATLGGTQ
jgi:hypothetical protein